MPSPGRPKTEGPKSIRLSITIREDILQLIDDLARERRTTRSGFLTQLAERAIRAAMKRGEKSRG